MAKKYTPRFLAVDILTRVREEGAYLSTEQDRVFREQKELSGEDRSFLYVLTYGTVEHLISVDAILRKFIRTSLRKLYPEIRSILELAIYQIFYMESVPDYAAINEAVELSRKKGRGAKSGFVNGVLRNILREKDKIRLNAHQKAELPEDLYHMWVERYGKEKTWQMADAFLAPHAITLRVNQNKITLSELKEELLQEGIETEEVSGYENVLLLKESRPLAGLSSFQNGYFYVQDLSTLDGMRALPLKAGDRVLDLCAAPGGKSLYAAELVGEDGFVTARDQNDYKVQKLNENIRRMGITNMKAELRDASVYDEDAKDAYDAVICDLPCSGLGVLSRKPELKFRYGKESEEGLIKLQRCILNQGVFYVKKGGYLLYSTCTLTAGENEENVSYITENYPEYHVEVMKEILPEASLRDGFFYCLLRRSN